MWYSRTLEDKNAHFLAISLAIVRHFYFPLRLNARCWSIVLSQWKVVIFVYCWRYGFPYLWLLNDKCVQVDWKQSLRIFEIVKFNVNQGLTYDDSHINCPGMMKQQQTNAMTFTNWFERISLAFTMADILLGYWFWFRSKIEIMYVS